MARSLSDARRWMVEGTKVFLDEVGRLDEAAHQDDTLLAGWTRKHLISHVASNAEAVGNLVRWAATGEETRMYSSPEERAAGIDRGPSMFSAELGTWLRRTADELEGAMERLTEDQWQASVLTARGRTVPASETPWMRAREVWIHAVDLDFDVRFSDLPNDFLEALIEDVSAQRGDVEVVEGPLADVAAWLTGRPHSLGGRADLGPWL